MHRIVFGLLIFNFLTVQPSILSAQDNIRDLVVKIHAVHHTPDVLRPWTKNSPQQVKGSGVVIEGKRILTNAHVVRYASQIYVQPNQSAERIPARVEAMTPSMDLAVLKLMTNHSSINEERFRSQRSCRGSKIPLMSTATQPAGRSFPLLKASSLASNTPTIIFKPAG